MKVYLRVYAYCRIMSVREDWVKRHTLPRLFTYQIIRFIREIAMQRAGVAKASFSYFRIIP